MTIKNRNGVLKFTNKYIKLHGYFKMGFRGLILLHGSSEGTIGLRSIYFPAIRLFVLGFRKYVYTYIYKKNKLKNDNTYFEHTNKQIHTYNTIHDLL